MEALCRPLVCSMSHYPPLCQTEQSEHIVLVCLSVSQLCLNSRLSALNVMNASFLLLTPLLLWFAVSFQLAYQVVELQQQIKIKECLLEEQHTR